MPTLRPTSSPNSPAQPSQASNVLAIDVGNSRNKFGLLQFDSAPQPRGVLPSLIASLAVRHGNPLPWQELERFFENKSSRNLMTIIAGVNPDGIQRVLSEWPAELPAPTHVRDYHQLGMKVAVDYPEKVGIDRLLNGVAASHFRQEKSPVLVVDTGTATTVDRISPSGVFEGGAILPGLELSGLALHRYTALLPQILPEELAPEGEPPQPLGRNTRDAIRSGLYWSQVGAVRELIRQLTPEGVQPVILITGGAAPLLVPQLQSEGEVRAEEHLPLKGLALVAQQLQISSPSA